MAFQLGSCTCGIILLLATLAPFAHGGKMGSEATLQMQESFLKSMSSGSCNGEKMDIKKVAKSLAGIANKCKIKGKDEISVACYMAEFGFLKTQNEAYDDPKKLVQNLDKEAWYTKSTNKKIAKEIYSKNCNKQFADKDKAEEGVMCVIKAILKVCGN